MSDTDNKALLPIGLRDVLPPDAEREAHAVDTMLGVFSANGYQRVKPPLIEFEESLLDGAGAATARETFRVMDPVSQRMMGVRADMTIQVARIATSRLARQPRPLRLCYAGQVLRVKGNQLRPDRQFTQAGLELIGAETPLADAEVVSLVVAALHRLGVPRLTVDLTLPTLVPALCDDMDLSRQARAKLRAALDQKDAAAVRAMGGDIASLFGPLLACAGDAADVLARLNALALPRLAAERRQSLATVAGLLQQAGLPAALTIDAVENRGFEYHSGISFSIFARGVRGELGRGGRYRTGSGGEKAVGASLFVDVVSEGMPPAPPVRRLLVAAADQARAAGWQAEGWITLAALDPALTNAENLAAEARRLGCCHYSVDGQIRATADQRG